MTIPESVHPSLSCTDLGLFSCTVLAVIKLLVARVNTAVTEGHR